MIKLWFLILFILKIIIVNRIPLLFNSSSNTLCPFSLRARVPDTSDEGSAFPYNFVIKPNNLKATNRPWNLSQLNGQIACATANSFNMNIYFAPLWSSHHSTTTDERRSQSCDFSKLKRERWDSLDIRQKMMLSNE